MSEDTPPRKLDLSPTQSLGLLGLVVSFLFFLIWKFLQLRDLFGGLQAGLLEHEVILIYPLILGLFFFIIFIKKNFSPNIIKIILTTHTLLSGIVLILAYLSSEQIFMRDFGSRGPIECAIVKWAQERTLATGYGTDCEKDWRNANAVLTDKKEMCQDEECLYNISISTKDVRICKTLTLSGQGYEGPREKCFFYHAKIKNNIELCNKENVGSYSKNCYQNLGIETGNKEACMLTDDPNRENYCLERIQKNIDIYGPDHYNIVN